MPEQPQDQAQQPASAQAPQHEAPAAPASVPTPQAPTSASQFRKDATKRAEGELIELTTGHVVRCARPSVNNLVKTGQLPSELANAAIKIQSGGSVNDNDMKRYVEYNERIIKLSLVSPKVVEQPNYDEDQISIDDLTDDERSEILLYVNGGLDALAKFRSGRSGVPTGSDLS